MEPYIKINRRGTTFYFKDEAMTILHREDGPAVEYANGDKEWYLNGTPHREDGPAVEYANVYTAWWLNGVLHREDGPAIEWADGHKVWYINGEKHREDGHAVELADGTKYWYLNGKKYTEADFNRITKADKDATIADLKEQLAAALKENERLRK